MQADQLTVDIGEDGVAVVTLNRPDKLNAMNPEFFRQLPACLDRLDAEPAVRAVVLTGAGRAFSTGGDIASFAELSGVAAHRRYLRQVFDAFGAVERAGLPVICAVNGLAYGGGTELALACDIVLASERATFAFREPALGLMPGWGIIRGPDVIGRHWTRWLALSGDIIDARQALSIGLVQRVLPHDRLLPEARSLAARIAAHPPTAVAVGKRLANRRAGAGFAESLEATALLFTTTEHRQRVRAFLDRGRGPAARPAGPEQTIRDYEDVRGYTLDPERQEELLRSQNECSFVWSTRDGWPVGVTMSYVWRDGRVWLTSSSQRKRVAAVRRDDRVTVIISGAGTPLGPGKTITIKGRCQLRHDQGIKAWFYPALAQAVFPDSAHRRAGFVRLLDSPNRVVFEVTPVALITHDIDKLARAASRSLRPRR